MSSTPDYDVPAYVRDGIRRQDLDTLREVRDLVDDVIDEREQLAEEAAEELEEELGDVDQSTLDDLEGGGGTTVVKPVSCGKDNCSKCPHGPYEYLVTWNGESLDWEYRGKAGGDS